MHYIPLGTRYWLQLPVACDVTVCLSFLLWWNENPHFLSFLYGWGGSAWLVAVLLQSHMSQGILPAWLSVLRFPSSYRDTSHWMRVHSKPVWPHLNMITSAKRPQSQVLGAREFGGDATQPSKVLTQCQACAQYFHAITNLITLYPPSSPHPSCIWQLCIY